MLELFIVSVAAAVATPGAQIMMEYVTYRIRLAFIAPKLIDERDARIAVLEQQVGEQAEVLRRAEDLIDAIGSMRDVTGTAVRKAG